MSSSSSFFFLPFSSAETPSFMRPLEDRTVARGETAVLQCIAGGSPAPRLNWTKDDGPLVLTERHFFAAANQLLIIVDAGPADAGKYTCIMSNTLGTERGHIYLSVSPSPNCDTGTVYDQDAWTTVGIVVIVVVCCVVGTSLVWVIVIYHMRRKSEDYSITNTGKVVWTHSHLSCNINVPYWKLYPEKMAACKLKCFRGHFVLKSWHRTENMFPLQMRWICQQIFPATYPLRVLCLSLRRVTVILRLGATSSSCLPSLMDMSIRARTVGYLPFEFETENNSSLLHLQTKLDISVVSCQYLWRIFLVL